jgi:hypothetical protein
VLLLRVNLPPQRGTALRFPSLSPTPHHSTAHDLGTLKGMASSSGKRTHDAIHQAQCDASSRATPKRQRVGDDELSDPFAFITTAPSPPTIAGIRMLQSTVRHTHTHTHTHTLSLSLRVCYQPAPTDPLLRSPDRHIRDSWSATVHLTTGCSVPLPSCSTMQSMPEPRH